jgi:hypothetical protein
MIPRTRREIALFVAESNLGRWYSWGGDDPNQGFDCSGLMIEVLSAAGVFPRGDDTTAAGLRQRYQRVSQPRPGDLLFWGEPPTHVEMVWVIVDGTVFTIGASGGGSRTRTREDAIRDNAFIKIRPARAGWTAADPFTV